MIESEAKQLVCPFMTQGQVIPIEGGTELEDYIYMVNCQTTKCMAWKQTEEYSYTNIKIIDEEKVKSFPSIDELMDYIIYMYGSEYSLVPGSNKVGIKQECGEGYCRRLT